MQEENKNGSGTRPGQRIFGVVCKATPDDFQAWLNSAKTYDIYVIFSKSSRIGKLIISEEAWE